jgi:curved DNA-binding protein CbpA
MQEQYNLLGVSSVATPSEIKAAYHGKLKEFPAHQYPQEFKAIRAAYEAIRKENQQSSKDFLQIDSTQPKLNPKLLEDLREKAITENQVSLEELMQLTF